MIFRVEENTISKDMFDTLVLLFQSDRTSQKIILKNKLKVCKVNPFENVVNYLMRITQIHDKLATIEEAILDVELVNVSLNGFTKA